jgi:uroporphyrinogen decarboxylase
MTGRERLLTAIHNGKPDRLPCQVHCWMKYYLDTYLNGIDQYAAYDFFGMDPVIYTGPVYTYQQKDLANWIVDYREDAPDKKGNTHWQQRITTPSGVLTEKGICNKYTQWTTEYLIKEERDFEIWNRYLPVPEGCDWSPVRKAKERIGDRGIVRGGYFDFGQGSPWQSFCTLRDTETAIYDCVDSPDWVHFVLTAMLQKKISVIERCGKCELDIVETGGGAGSGTVISPSLHREFCLPYDKKQHEALHAADANVVYHLCGGVMPMLDLVAENGTDGLETMTPPEMGGDCNLFEASSRVGSKLFFIGGFDQNGGFENGNPQLVREMVFSLHRACPDGGYICSPSDHFFFGDPSNIRAFAEAAKECTY